MERKENLRLKHIREASVHLLKSSFLFSCTIYIYTYNICIYLLPLTAWMLHTSFIPVVKEESTVIVHFMSIHDVLFHAPPAFRAASVLLVIDSPSRWTLLEGWTPFFQNMLPHLVFWWWWRALSDMPLQNLPCCVGMAVALDSNSYFIIFQIIISTPIYSDSSLTRTVPGQKRVCATGVYVTLI